jgi:hypothetical protein
VRVLPGDAFADWDLEVRSGMVGTARMRLLAEEHGEGHQLVRIRLWSRCAWPWLALIGLLLSGAAASVVDGAGLAAVPLTGLAVVMIVRAMQGCAGATAALLAAIATVEDGA